MNTNNTNHKWFILFLGTLTFIFAVGGQRACIPVLFKEILDDLGLNILEVGTIWGMDSFAGIFVAIPAGLVIDRFSVKGVLTVFCLAIGIFGALRGISKGFVSMMATMFFFGLFTPAMATLVPKTVAVWFDKRRLGLANGILNMGISVGQMLSVSISATVMSPLLGGWRNVLFFYSIIPVLIAALWHFFAKDYQVQGKDTSLVRHLRFREAFGEVSKIRQVWMLSLIMLGHMGAYGAFIGYLPLYLREFGWSAIHADAALTAYLAVVSITGLPTTMISDRIGSRKKILVPAMTLEAVTLAAIPFVNSTTLWIMIILHGIVRGGLTALIRALIVETKGVGPACAGTAIGIVTTFLMIGYSVFPPLGGSLAHINLGLPFVLWASLLGMVLFSFFFVKEE